MRETVNIVARATIDDCVWAIQNLTRAFTVDRTPRSVLRDLELGQEALRRAMENIDTALAIQRASLEEAADPA